MLRNSGHFFKHTVIKVVFIYLKTIKMKFIFSTLLLLLSVLFTHAQYRHDSIPVEKGFLHFYTFGKGKPIVHLQGGPGFSSYYMRAIADSLPDYMNILIDYQGTGLSQNKKEDTSWVNIQNIVKDIEKVRKKLNINKWIVNGHSYGSQFALYYATQHLEAVSKLVLIASTGTDNKFQRYFMDNVSARLSKEDMKAFDTYAADTTINPMEKEMMLQSILLKGYFFDKDMVNGFLSSIPLEQLPTFNNSTFFDAYTSNPSFWTFDMSKSVYKLTMPVRIIEGRQDPGVDGTQEILNARLRNSKLTYIEKCGHFPWVEQPIKFFSTLRLALTK
jgi:proline iminopeptidase